MHNYLRFQTALLIVAALAGPGPWAQEHQDHDHDHAGQATAAEFSGDPYLLDTDAATGEKLGPVAEQVILELEGREFRFNSEESAEVFRSAPAGYVAKVDAALVTQQLPFYPLETCPISGEELGGMGESVDMIYRNRLVRLCCKGCKKKFLASPGAVISKLDAAVIAAQKPEYPTKTCVVSGEALDGDMGESIDYVIGNRLVRLCCKNCKKRVAKDPLAYLAKLGMPAMAGHGDDGGHEHGSHEHGSH